MKITYTMEYATGDLTYYLKDINGNLAKNGFYKYVITGRDIAENESTASIERFELKNIYTSALLWLKGEDITRG